MQYNLQEREVLVSSCQHELREQRNQSKKQEPDRLFRQPMCLRGLRRDRESGCENGLVLKGFVERPRKAFHHADVHIDAETFLHSLILGITLVECSWCNPAEKCSGTATSEQSPKCGALSETVTRPEMSSEVSVFMVTMTRCNVASNNLTDAQGYLSAAASSWRPQQVAPDAFEEGENVKDTYEWDAQSAEHEAQEPKCVAEADAYCGKDGAWDESAPQDCGELEEPFGSLETRKRRPRQNWVTPPR